MIPESRKNCPKTGSLTNRRWHPCLTIRPSETKAALVLPGMVKSSTFFRRSIPLAAAGAAIAALAGCDSNSSTAPGANPRQVTVVGSGQVQGVPDTLTANVGIEFTAPDVTTAMNQTNDRQQAVINALVGAGMDRKNISTTAVTLQPQYSNPEPAGTATIAGYRATNA